MKSFVYPQDFAWISKVIPKTFLYFWSFSWQITCQCFPSIELERSFVGGDFVRGAARLNITTLLSRSCRRSLSILWLHHSFILIHFWGRFSTVCTLHIIGTRNRSHNLKNGMKTQIFFRRGHSPVWRKGFNNCSISVKVVNYNFFVKWKETTGHPPLHFVKWIIERLRVNGPLIREERLLSFPPALCLLTHFRLS